MHLVPKLLLAETTERAVIFQTVTLWPLFKAVHFTYRTRELNVKRDGGKKKGRKMGEKYCKREINRKHLAAGVTQTKCI